MSIFSIHLKSFVQRKVHERKSESQDPTQFDKTDDTT